VAIIFLWHPTKYFQTETHGPVPSASSSPDNLKGLYDNLGIKGIYITSGRNKAMGAADLELTDEQRDILQSLVDEAYEQFVEIVAEGRK